MEKHTLIFLKRAFASACPAMLGVAIVLAGACDSGSVEPTSDAGAADDGAMDDATSVDSAANEPPRIEITSPIGGGATELTSIVVTGTALDSDGAIVGVSVAGVEATTTDAFATWEARVPLKSGDNTVEAIATNGDGATAVDQIVFEQSYRSIRPSSAAISDSASGDVYFSVGRPASLYRLSTMTGVVTRVYSATSASGGAESYANIVAIGLSDSTTLWSATRQGAIFEQDLVTGSMPVLISGTVSNSGPTPDSSVTDAIRIAGGDFVMVDSSNRNILRVDGTTGDRTLVSDAAGLSSVYFRSRLFHDSSSDQLYVTTPASVLAVAMTTGLVTVVSSASVGSGPSFNALTDVDSLPSSGELLIVSNDQQVMRVSKTTGDRNIVASASIGSGAGFCDFEINAITSVDATSVQIFGNDSRVINIDVGSRARSAVFRPGYPSTYTLDPELKVETVAWNASEGTILLLDAERLVEFSPRTGITRVVTDAAVAGGASGFFSEAEFLRVDVMNNRAVVATEDDDVWWVDLSSGAQSLLSSSTMPAGGAAMPNIEAVAVSPVLSRVFVLGRNGDIIAIDAESGMRSILSSATVPNTDNTISGGRDLIASRDGLQLFVSGNPGTDGVYKVDAATGVRSVVLDVATVAELDYPEKIARDDGSEDFFVGGYLRDAGTLIRFDAATDAVETVELESSGAVGANALYEWSELSFGAGMLWGPNDNAELLGLSPLTGSHALYYQPRSTDSVCD